MDIDVTSQAVRITAIIAALSPLLIAVFTQFHWSTQVKQIISAVVAGAVGVIVALTSGAPVTWQNAGALALLAIGASQFAYSILWKPTGVAPAIEAATSTSPGGVPTSSKPVDPEPISDEALAAIPRAQLAANEPTVETIDVGEPADI